MNEEIRFLMNAGTIVAATFLFGLVASAILYRNKFKKENDE